MAFVLFFVYFFGGVELRFGDIFNYWWVVYFIVILRGDWVEFLRMFGGDGNVIDLGWVRLFNF